MPASPRAASKPISIGSAAGAQRGVGLVEVLVAVLILSMGLLGITLVQTRALSNSNSAMGRSMAVVASYSILEAMRIERENAITTLPYNTTVVTNACPTSTGTLAETQLGTWCAELRNRFGNNASTAGTVNCTTAGICTITVRFDESRGGEGLYSSTGGTAETVVTRAAL